MASSYKYIECVSVQLLLLEYYKQYNHPFLLFFQHSSTSLIGDDIELGNRLLAQTTKSDSRRSDVQLLNDTYQSLGVMMRVNAEFLQDVEELQHFNKGDKRYVFKEDDETLQFAETYWIKTLRDMLMGKWKHYEIPKSVAPKFTEINTNSHETMKLSSKNTGTKEEEIEKMELIAVEFLGVTDSKNIVNNSMDTLWKNSLAWKFSKQLDNKVIMKMGNEMKKYLNKEMLATLDERTKEMKRKRKRKKAGKT